MLTKGHNYQKVELSVTKHRDRIGCDVCKKDTATEAFIGYLGHVLWICGDCFKKITKKGSKQDSFSSKGKQKQ